MTTRTPSPKGNGKFLGRPTKYDPAFCDKIIELGRQGKSKVQMVADTGIPYATMTRWCDEYPEFRAAMDHAMHLAQAYWEDLGHTHMVESPGGPRLNTGLWSRSMAARFPRDNREETSQP